MREAPYHYRNQSFNLPCKSTDLFTFTMEIYLHAFTKEIITRKLLFLCSDCTMQNILKFFPPKKKTSSYIIGSA